MRLLRYQIMRLDGYEIMRPYNLSFDNPVEGYKKWYFIFRSGKTVSEMSGNSLKSERRMEQDRISKSSAEFSKRAFQRAGCAQQTSWPMLTSQSGLFLNGVERQGVLKISGQRSDGLGLSEAPGLAESSIAQTSFGFVRSLPNASR